MCYNSGIETRRCTKCGNIKAFEFFYKSKVGKYGIESKCKECSNIEKHLWRIKNPEKSYTHSKTNQKRVVQNITRSYISTQLKIPTSLLTDELFELKREHVLTIRALKLLNKTIKELNEK